PAHAAISHLSLHDALPIWPSPAPPAETSSRGLRTGVGWGLEPCTRGASAPATPPLATYVPPSRERRGDLVVSFSSGREGSCRGRGFPDRLLSRGQQVTVWGAVWM